MKLNADIIFDNLKSLLPVSMNGPKETALNLEQPYFFLEGTATFEEDTLYIARAEHLPSHCNIKRGVVIVAIGNSLQLQYYKDRCCIIQVPATNDTFYIANLVQDIFRKYEAWRERLEQVISTTASVQDMVLASESIFEAPILVLDAHFGILGNLNNTFVEPEPDMELDVELDVGDHLNLGTLGTFLGQRELSLEERDPMIINILDKTVLALNLYRKEEYFGSLAIDLSERQLRGSDKELAKWFAAMLLRAIAKLPMVAIDELDTSRNALQNLVNCLNVDLQQRKRLEKLSKGKFVCVKLILSNRLQQLPVNYISSELESHFPQSVAFSHNRATVGILRVNQLADETGDYLSNLKNQLSRFIESVDVTIGVSDPFSNLMDVRLYYQQASAALSGGSLVRQSDKYYLFQDYALTKLVANAIGDLPVELYFTEGIRKLIERDKSSTVSYIDTLRVYLDNNMSVTKTANALYLHRSTLIDRMARMEKELDVDLSDPEERLRIEILLKALELNAKLHEE